MMKKPTAAIALCAGLVLFAGAVTGAAAQAYLSGSVSTGDRLFFIDNAFESAVKLDLALTYEADAFSAYSEFGLAVDPTEAVDVSRFVPALSLGETYATFSPAEGLSFTAGNRILSWGTALASNPEGFVNPVDTGAQLASDKRGDWLLPVPLVAAKYIAGPFAVELAAVPQFRPNSLPAKGSRWYPDELATLDFLDGKTISGVSYTVNDIADPSATLASTQAGGRASLSAGPVDFGLSGWYGWTKNPVYDVAVVLGAPVDVAFSPGYRRQTSLGFDLSASVLGSSILWAEGAFNFPAYFAGTDSMGLPALYEAKNIVAAAGLDRTISLGGWGDLYLALEGNIDVALDYDELMTRDAYIAGGVGVVEVRDSAGNFSFRIVGMEPDFLTMTDTKQYLVRASVEVKPADGYTIVLGGTLIQGDSGLVGQFADNDFASLSLKASF